MGDRAAHLQWAAARLAEWIHPLTVSAFHETAPVDMPAEAGAFLNAAATGQTDLSPQALLGVLQAIERERGRQRPFRNAPRTLDLDLILYGDAVVETAGLTLPHPRFRDRAFVLAPLAEVAPALVDPITGLSVAALWQRLTRTP